jgi:hypothetical protein
VLPAAQSAWGFGRADPVGVGCYVALAQVRLKRVQHRRKLVEMVKTQNEEMTVLRDEVERLRMKTFPSFGVAARSGRR